MKHEKAPTTSSPPPPTPDSKGYWIVRTLLMFLKIHNFWSNLASFRGQIWPKLSKDTSTHQDLKFESITKSLWPTVINLDRTSSYFKNNVIIGHFGQIRPTSVAESARNCQKAHLHANAFHLRPLPRLYITTIRYKKNSMWKLMFRKKTLF